MKKPQWITISIAVVAVVAIYAFARTKPLPGNLVKQVSSPEGVSQSDLTDSILSQAKRQISSAQLMRITRLENSISRGDVKGQKLDVLHQLAHFWGDSAGFFAPYAWYEAEAARLENSEKTLTFAAHLLLENLQHEDQAEIRRWEALQAKDLFERSLNINPGNDSSRIGLGACYLFGGISEMPMEGIAKIREVITKDSTNVYAQLTLVKGSMMTGQYNNAISRLQTVLRFEPANIEAILLLADVYERTQDRAAAIRQYQESLKYIQREDARQEIQNRIAELKK